MCGVDGEDVGERGGSEASEVSVSRHGGGDMCVADMFAGARGEVRRLNKRQARGRTGLRVRGRGADESLPPSTIDPSSRAPGPGWRQ